jgi:hypothetical protein
MCALSNTVFLHCLIPLYRPFTAAHVQQQHQHTAAAAASNTHRASQAVAWQCGGGLCERNFNELNLLNSNYLNIRTIEEPRIVQYSLVAKGRAVLFGERSAPTTVARLVDTAPALYICTITRTVS